jgi:hypothetical protein
MNETFPLRITRATTGTVHAAREHSGVVVATGKAFTEIRKACGWDNNGFGVRNGKLLDTDAEVTCKKCLKKLG